MKNDPLKDVGGFLRRETTGFPRLQPKLSEADEQTISLNMTESAPEVQIAGYTIIRELKKGGQGVIYLAVQESTGRKVAIKLVYQAKVSQEEHERMDREVRVLAELDHSSIVSIIDRGSTREGWPYFVMEYIQGKTLQQWIEDYQQRHAPIGIPADLTEILRLFTRICDTINTAHLRGIVHRDMKPANIIIDTYGDPHILDFGLAHGAAAWLARGKEDTKTGHETFEFQGSLPWASPEQAEGDLSKIDTRTDVYSLGVILFQMLTGDFPYEVFGKALDTLQNIRSKQPLPPATVIKKRMSETIHQKALSLRRTLNPIDSRLDRIVLKALEKEQGARYQTAGEFSREINQYLSGKPSSVSAGGYERTVASPALIITILIAIAAGVGIYLHQAGVFSKTETGKRQPSAIPVEDTDKTAAQTPGLEGKPEDAAPDFGPMQVWGYKVDKEKNTIVFEFNPTFYRLGRYEDGNLGQLPPPEEVKWVNVAGNFNGWNATDAEWLLMKNSEMNWSLEKPISVFREKPSWTFKFIVNGNIWIGAPELADNRVRVPGDTETYNFVLYNPEGPSDTQFAVTRVYRQQIERNWPGMSPHLSLDDDMKYSFSMVNLPHHIKISGLEPLRGIPLGFLNMGEVFVTDFEPLHTSYQLKTIVLGSWLYDYLMAETLKAVTRSDYARARTSLDQLVQPNRTIPAFDAFGTLMLDSIAGLEQLSASPQTIPSTVKVFRGRKYLFVPLKKSWVQAKAFCEQFNAHLATATSPTEQEWLVKNFSEISLGQAAWLGGTDVESEGEWRWVNGEKWEFSNWTGVEPNNLYGSENALLLQWNGDWHDASEANETAPFIIEWEAE